MKFKVLNWICNPTSHTTFHANSQGSSKPWVLCGEQYDGNWYVDNGCSHNLTGRKECLRDFWKLENVGVVNFGKE